MPHLHIAGGTRGQIIVLTPWAFMASRAQERWLVLSECCGERFLAATRAGVYCSSCSRSAELTPLPGLHAILNRHHGALNQALWEVLLQASGMDSLTATLVASEAMEELQTWLFDNGT